MAYDIGPRIGIDGEAEFRKSILRAAQAVKTLNSEMKAVSSAFAGNERSIQSYAAKNEVLRKSIDAQEDKIQLLNKGLSAAAAKFGEADTRTLKWQQAVNEATAELNRMRGELARNEQEMSDLGDETEDMGDALDDAGRSALSFGDILKANIISDLVVDGIRKLTDGLKQFTGFSMQAGMNFEAQMSRVQAISGATTDDTERLADKAKEMGESTVFSATESAQALEYMAMAGWKTEDMLEGLPGVMNLAAASGEELATVSDIVTDALTAFGMSAKDSNHFADVLAVASANANTNVSMMGETFKYVGAASGALGYSIEDVALGIGLMANSGIKASQAGTELNSIFTRLSTNTSGARDAIENLGIGFYNADGSARAFGDVMAELRDATRGMTQEQKINFANTVAGQRAQAGLIAMLDATEADYLKITTAIQDCDDAAEEMAATMTNNLSGAMTLMQSAAEGVGIAIYERVSTPLTNLATEINENVLPAIKNLITGEGDLKSVGDAIGSFFSSIPEEFSKIFPELEGGISGLVTELVGKLGDSLGENLPKLIDTGLTFLADFAASFRENAGMLVDAGLRMVQSLAEGLMDSLPSLIEKVPGIVSDIAGVINDNAPKLIVAAAKLIATLGAGLIKAIPALVKNIPSIINAIVNVILAFNWVNLGSSIVKGLVNGIKSLIGSVTTTGKTIVQNLRTVMSDLPGYMSAIGKDMIKGLWNGIKGMGGWIKDMIKGWGLGLLSSIKNLFKIKSPSRVMRDEVGKNLALGVGVGFTDGFDGVSRKITRSMSGLSSDMMAAADLHQIQRGIDSAAAAVTEVPSRAAVLPAGSVPAVSGGVSAGELAAAVREALNGARVMMDGRAVGRLTMLQQSNMGRALGTA